MSIKRFWCPGDRDARAVLAQDAVPWQLIPRDTP